MSNGEELSLLPCPFCGGTAEWYDITEADEVGNAGGSCIICTKCQACGPVQFGEKDTIVDQWNRRSSPSAVEAAEVVGWQPGERALALKWATKLLAKLSTKPDHADDCLWLIRLSYFFASPPPASPSAPQGVEVRPVIAQITALLELDATGKLVPHGIGGLARELLTTCRGILSAIQTSPEAGR